MLEWPIKLMRADPFFEVTTKEVWNESIDYVVREMGLYLDVLRPDVMMILGDRFEILATATAAHLLRVPIAHIGGGDITEGSYDDAMRDAISRMASLHFVTSTSAMAKLSHMGYRNVHLVGSPGVDYIQHANWKSTPPFEKPYVVLSYQCETIDGTNQIGEVLPSLPHDKRKVLIMPNPDRGNEVIREALEQYTRNRSDASYHEWFPHDQFLNLLSHCDEFIGNSSAMLYEAPYLGIKTRMIGKRQRGRTIPWGDGHASERIVHILKYGAL